MTQTNENRNDTARHPAGAARRTILLGTVAALALTGAIAQDVFFNGHSANAATATAATALPAAGPQSFADVVERVKGSVVSIKVKSLRSNVSDDDEEGPRGLPQVEPGSPMDQFFRQFGIPNGPGARGVQPRQQQPRQAMSQGSGFFVSADGYIVTNNHVVENGQEVTITTVDGKEIAATVIGKDKRTDLAVLKTKEGGNYPYVTFAKAAPRVGDWVIAVGNPFGLGGTVTAGIVSARARDIGSGPYDNYIQIDAPVNRGNSGGPTFNAQGEVIGVNTAIYSPSGGSVGIGFAIDTSGGAQDIIAALRDNGSVSRGWLGVQIQPVTDDLAEGLGVKDTKGALVAGLQDNAPAGKAGIRAGDVVTAVNGEAVAGPRELSRKIASLGPAKSVDLTINRAGRTQTVKVELGTMPDEGQRRADRGGSREQTAPAPLAALGMTLAPVSAVPGAGDKGVAVTDVEQGGLASEKGMRSGDVILEVAGQAVSRPADVASAIAKARKDGAKAVLFLVKNGDSTRFVAIVPASRQG